MLIIPIVVRVAYFELGEILEILYRFTNFILSL